MDPRKLFFDERAKGMCAYCGSPSDTRDHVPSKVFLDKPYPENLAVVCACEECNNGFSADELYVACLLESIVAGSVDRVERDQIQKRLKASPNLAHRISKSRVVDQDGQVWWRPEIQRLRNVVVKLARGHAAFWYSEPQLGQPSSVHFAPVPSLAPGDLAEFGSLPRGGLLPEIGSRAFHEAGIAGGRVVGQEGTWQSVQEGRYAYAVSHSFGIQVRFVLRDYLACTVAWA